jgi:hypothetical protein
MRIQAHSWFQSAFPPERIPLSERAAIMIAARGAVSPNKKAPVQGAFHVCPCLRTRIDEHGNALQHPARHTSTLLGNKMHLLMDDYSALPAMRRAVHASCGYSQCTCFLPSLHRTLPVKVLPALAQMALGIMASLEISLE